MIQTINNYDEFIQVVANKGTFKAYVSDQVLNEFIDRQVSFKVLEKSAKGYTLVKIYE